MEFAVSGSRQVRAHLHYCKRFIVYCILEMGSRLDVFASASVPFRPRPCLTLSLRSTVSELQFLATAPTFITEAPAIRRSALRACSKGFAARKAVWSAFLCNSFWAKAGAVNFDLVSKVKNSKFVCSMNGSAEKVSDRRALGQVSGLEY